MSDGVIVGGFVLLASAWGVLYRAARSHTLATAGVYAHLRHPQYVAFILILLGLLIQWPTILTLLMFPALVVMYRRLARREERDALATFGPAYIQYAAQTPRFLPRRSAVQHRHDSVPRTPDVR